ncbi:Multidrug/Oligosaccharidyl-lipid/Polysaccharide (MOP) Flippase Superfamily [Phytophthora cinnamomi]|uniref:Multidrug/Oligosaccharidyl-lipid/Polysaccharide (MOP) Flippase Superfamily n=1 Tax=Phytophthora cinnamomi TaxID=4785 RepID=UPI00355AB1DB|nr:Multidrug/Oligosaccharidyl-lipid/Polysaccharide (MOP) Flippase Superfamily [Phytophthora cinnamomi]
MPPPKGEKAPLLLDGEADVDVAAEFWGLTGMALQVSLSTFARIALISVDSAFLGHLGTASLAAASLASTWTNVPLAGVWSGATALVTLCGQAWGARNGELAGTWLQIGLVVVSLLSLPVVLWYWSVGCLLALSTDDAEVVRLGVRFARILSLSVWPSLVYACVRLYLQSMGIMSPVTVVGALSIGVACAANYTLIFGALGWGGLGFDGSPMATVIAAWFQPLALISYCICYRQMHLQAWGGWDLKAFTRERLRVFLNISGPVAANSMVSNLANSALTLVAARLGADVIAANAVISGLWSLLWALFWGFGSATQIRVANYLGAGRPKAARVLGFLGFVCTVGTVATLAVVTFLLRETLFRLYSNDDALLQLCMLVQPIFITGYMIESVEILVSSVLAGMGEVSVTAWVSSLSVWCIELPIAYFGGVTLGFGFSALWYGVCTMEVLKLSIFAYVLSRTDWAEMAARAVKTMEAASDSDTGVEQESLQYAMAEGANTPGNLAPVVRSPAQGLMTPSGRRRQWDQIEDGGLMRSPFFGRSPRPTPDSFSQA